jgi:hypothetical protein
MIIITCPGGKPVRERPEGQPTESFPRSAGMEEDLRMSRRTRWIIFLVGLLVLVCSLLAVGYALWPVGGTVEQATLAPTLFAPP